MGHWSEGYVGIPYSDKFDCGHLVQRVLKEKFDKSINFPSRMTPGYDLHTVLLKKHKDDFACEITDPQDGDGVLMRSGPMWHIGVYFRSNNDSWVLHNSKARGGVVVNRIRDLNNSGLKLLGYYEWLNV